MVIGVGGTIGSGKTTVSRIFESMGSYYISADEIGWEVLSDIAPILRKRYGSGIMDGESIDRNKLAARVFTDPEELTFLNSISHPLLIERLKARITQASGSLVVVDAALLFDWPEIMAIVDYPVLVIAHESLKEQRSIAHGIDRTRYRTIRQNQHDDSHLASKARFTINNNGAVEALYDQCRSILKEIQHGH
ncbi:dephospho-CoA kinase [candidate division WOR-3 bacterium]|nr:dephospho-CoA kinase [candidate division WOR-3 bacterium]